MTVTDVKLNTHNFPSPATSAFGGDNLSEQYIVNCDDINDGPATISAIIGNPAPGPDRIPLRGEAWAWGNDSAAAVAIQHEFERVKVEDSGGLCKWYVNVEYEYQPTEPNPGSAGGSRRPNGLPAAVPDQVQPICEPGYRIVNEPVGTAEFLGYFDKDGSQVFPAVPTLIPANSPMPIQNSALDPFLPVPEEPKAYPTLRIVKYYRQWNNDFDEMVGATNLTQFTVNHVDGSGQTIYNRVFVPDSLFCNHIQPRQEQYGDQLWYALEFEFWIGDFVRKFVDRGIRELVETSKWQPISNEYGEAAQTPFLLDGGGKKKNPEDTSPLYLHYRTKKQYEFNNVGPLP